VRSITGRAYLEVATAAVRALIFDDDVSNLGVVLEVRLRGVSIMGHIRALFDKFTRSTPRSGVGWESACP